MALRDDLLPVVEAARGIAEDLGIRTTRVYVVRRDWSSGDARTGEAVDTRTEITPRPKVKDPGGGTLIVGPITPAHATGGFAPATLLPADDEGTEHLFELVGPSGEAELYRLAGVDSRRPFRYMLVLQSLNRVSPTFD